MQKVTSSWFFLSTLNYDARSPTHQIYENTCKRTSVRLTKWGSCACGDCHFSDIQRNHVGRECGQHVGLFNVKCGVMCTWYRVLRAKEDGLVCFRILCSKSGVNEINISRQNLWVLFRHLLCKKQKYQSLHSYTCLLPSHTVD